MLLQNIELWSPAPTQRILNIHKSIPGNLMHASDFCGYYACAWYTSRYAGKTHTNLKIIKTKQIKYSQVHKIKSKYGCSEDSI